MLETGSGVSTVVLASALAAAGGKRVVALEHGQPWADRTRELLRLAGLADHAEVYFAPLKPQPLDGEMYEWYSLADAVLPDRIDLLFVDGPPGPGGKLSRFPALPLLWEHLGPEVLIVLDDADREDEREILRRWDEMLPDHVARLLPHDKGTGVLLVPGSPGVASLVE